MPLYTRQKSTSRLATFLRYTIFAILVLLVVYWIRFVAAFDVGKWTAKKFDLLDPNNPVMYLDIKIGEQPIGRVIVELYANIVPKTSENWRQLCLGGFTKDGKELTFKKNIFHRIIKNFIVQAGDITKGDGTGGVSIYGPNFPDENFVVKHNKPGILSMANYGPDTQHSQWVIFTVPSPHIDGKGVGFGRVLQGMDVVTIMENVETKNDKPVTPVIIDDCGQLS